MAPALRLCRRFLMIWEGAGAAGDPSKGSAEPWPFRDHKERPLFSRYRRIGHNARLPLESH
jgi:hypothetical protein